nr:hypothetical protein [Porphyromonas gingivalis]
MPKLFPFGARIFSFPNQNEKILAPPFSVPQAPVFTSHFSLFETFAQQTVTFIHLIIYRGRLLAAGLRQEIFMHKIIIAGVRTAAIRVSASSDRIDIR